MRDNILAVYNLSSDYERKEGLDWYQSDAWAFCLNLGWGVAARLGQLSQEMTDRHWAKFVAAVTAVMSPQKEWRVNKALADKVVHAVMLGEPVTGHYGPQCEKVVKLYRYFLIHRGVAFSDNDALNIISKKDAKKTRNFYLNILGNYDVVTVDGHAASICENGITRVSITDTKQPIGKEYDRYAAEYVEAAKIVGITPAQLQAITWVTYRRLDLVVKK